MYYAKVVPCSELFFFNIIDHVDQMIEKFNSMLKIIFGFIGSAYKLCKNNIDFRKCSLVAFYIHIFITIFHV